MGKQTCPALPLLAAAVVSRVAGGLLNDMIPKNSARSGNGGLHDTCGGVEMVAVFGAGATF